VVAVSQRSYSGPALDATVQHLGDAPYWQADGETVDVIDDREDPGEDTTENVPVPDSGRPEGAEGQTTLADWGWSA